jgi:hypothetical protein
MLMEMPAGILIECCKSCCFPCCVHQHFGRKDGAKNAAVGGKTLSLFADDAGPALWDHAH